MVRVLLDGELALSNGVPNFQILVSATASDLPVVWGESHSQNILGVGNKSPLSNSLVDVPESQSAVPTG